MNFRRFFGKVKSALLTIRSRNYPSYSQAGEDQLIRYLFQTLQISEPTYLDIGANHPFLSNNTFLFYSRGSCGVCVEPDPNVFRELQKHRRRDVLLNAGVTPGVDTNATLYIFPDPYTGWNTFSEVEAKSRVEETGIHYRESRPVKMVNINDVIETNFSRWPNLISIDVEGMDLAILQSLNFDRFKPEVLCVETVTFSMSRTEEKVNSVKEFLETKGYFLFGDTHINSVFCRKDIYK